MVSEESNTSPNDERPSLKLGNSIRPNQIKENQLVERLKKDPSYGSLTPAGKRLAQRIVRMRWRGNSYVRIQHPKRHRYDFVYLEMFNKIWLLTDFVAAEMRLAGKEVPKQWRTSRPRISLDEWSRG